MGKGKKGIGNYIFWKHRYTTGFGFKITEIDSMFYQVTTTHKKFGNN